MIVIEQSGAKEVDDTKEAFEVNDDNDVNDKSYLTKVKIYTIEKNYHFQMKARHTQVDKIVSQHLQMNAIYKRINKKEFSIK